MDKPTRSTSAAEQAGLLVRSHYARGVKQQSEGGPIAWCMRGVPDEILTSMDIYPAYPENYGTVCASKQVAVPLMETAEADGFSHDICGYLRVALGYAQKMAMTGGVPKDAPFGGMPKPTMFLSPTRLCDPRVKLFEAMRRYLGVPAYIFDVLCPPVDDVDCADRAAQKHYIDYNVESLRGLVGFLEEQVGRKLDQVRLQRAVANSLEVWRSLHEIHQMRRSVPCPLPSEDAFSLFFPAMWLAGTDEAVAFFREAHQEISERVRRKQGVIVDERFRLLWVGLPPYFDMGLFNYLEKQGAVSVMETTFCPTKPFVIDTTDPLRALAEKLFWGYDLGGSDGSEIRCGGLGGSYVLKLADEYKVDGVIVYVTRSCRAISIGSKNMVHLLKDKLNLPVTYIEADMTDPRDYNHAQIRSQIDAFIEQLNVRKNQRRS